MFTEFCLLGLKMIIFGARSGTGLTLKQKLVSWSASKRYGSLRSVVINFECIIILNISVMVSEYMFGTYCTRKFPFLQAIFQLSNVNHYFTKQYDHFSSSFVSQYKKLDRKNYKQGRWCLWTSCTHLCIAKTMT